MTRKELQIFSDMAAKMAVRSMKKAKIGVRSAAQVSAFSAKILDEILNDPDLRKEILNPSGGVDKSRDMVPGGKY